MFELKYFAKIAAFEEAERSVTVPPPLPPFRIEDLGKDGPIPRAIRRFMRWSMLFAFAVLRAVWPVARIGRLVVVTRHADVCTVLNDSTNFPVPFAPEMKAIGGGEIFALGLDGDAHAAQRGILDMLVVPDDAGYIIKRTRYYTEALIANSGGRIDVMRDLLGRVVTETCSDYFGLDLDEPNAFLDRSMAISALLFADYFGNEATRKLAMNGAVRVRYLIDRAITRARATPRRDPVPVIDRLVGHRLPCGGRLSNGQIRAMIIGVMTGMVPTTMLAAGKMIEELRRRDKLQIAIDKAVAAERARNDKNNPHRAALRDILLEAARLNPALFPGQLRHAPKYATIAGKPVPAGSVLIVATMSALRDPEQFPRPGNFEPGRKMGPLLMFGDGSHHCLGTYVALEQATEIFQILLAQPSIRFSKHPFRWLSYIGPFPRRLDLAFEPRTAPLTQTLVTIQAKVDPADLEAVQTKIEALGNPAHSGSAIGKALDKTGVVHFSALSAFDARDPDDPKAKPMPRLVFEASIDGNESAALDSIAREAGAELGPIFGFARDCKETDLGGRLKEHKVTLRSLPWGATGLNFNGTPDCPVSDIDRQDELVRFARDALDHYLLVHNGVHKRAMDALTYVRGLTRDYEPPPYKMVASVNDPKVDVIERDLRRRGRSLRHFLTRPTRRRLKMSEWTGSDAKIGWKGLGVALQSRAGLFLALLTGATFLLQGGAIHYALETTSSIAFALALTGVVVGAILIGALFVTSGFDKLVRGAILLKEAVIWLVTLLLFALSAVLFLVALLARWVAWPAILIAGGVTAFCVLLAWFPDTPLIGQVLLAAAGFVCSTLAILAGRALLERYWRDVLALLAGAGAALWTLEKWAPEMTSTDHVALAVVAGSATAALACLVRAMTKPLLPEFWPMIAWCLAIVVTATVGWAALHDWSVVRAVIGAAFSELGDLSIALVSGMVATLLIWLIPALTLAAALYWHEIHDTVDDRTAPLPDIAKIAAKENAPGYAQNHITAVTLMKPGPFRKLTLALTLWALGKEIQYWFRPGFVLNMGTIHYAKWFRLPDTEMMLFLANYDGSWQNYLEDFVTKAHEGQSAVWSHGKGFPKTRLLVFGGAADGDRFKRWVRRQQIVTQFWYSRFPKLTTERIRTNALIHDGLMRAQTDTAARAWLDCFGTIPRPDNTIETDEVQSLVFRGLPTHPVMICAAISFSADSESRKKWLEFLRDEVTFGEQPDLTCKPSNSSSVRPATFVAFSAQGIAKCLGESKRETSSDTMVTFPAAFRLGMASRGRILGDTGPSALESWRWADVDRIDEFGKADPAVDAMLLIYGINASACDAVLARHCALLQPAKVRTVITQPTNKTLEARRGGAAPESEQASPQYEHFGFRDGISQPVIRGSQREATVASKADVIEPGELILGYQNSGGYTAPAITLPAERDDFDDLETDTPDFPSRFPRFAGSHEADMRDFGRNGTFIAVRQLLQDVVEFNKFLSDQERVLKAYPGLAEAIGGPITADWIAAKIMGRWQSGASLVSWPHGMAGRAPPSKPDNDFNFAADDPQGLRCPFGAHIRRANPRGSLAPDDPEQAEIEKRHRILRRGRAYAEQKGDPEKGLLFVGLCADLERQFEFLQQTWIGSPFFQGLSNEPDPITTPPPAPGQEDHVFTIPTPTGSVTMKGLTSFVTVKAGGYFFMPSRSAIRFLTRLPGIPTPPAAHGPAVIERHGRRFDERPGGQP